MISHVSPLEARGMYSQWMQVDDNSASYEAEADLFSQDPSKDCIITDSRSIFIPHNTSIRIRNLVVFSKLKIEGPPSPSKHPTLSCKRICVFGGDLTVRNVSFIVEEAIIPATREQFARALPHLQNISAETDEHPGKQLFYRLPSHFQVNCDIDQISPLEITGLMCAARDADPGLLQLFLQLGANVEKRNGNQQSALHIAAQYNRPSNVKLLIAAKAVVDAQDYLGTTPLIMAAMYTSLAAMQSLILVGNANILAQDLLGHTVLRGAVDSGDREMINFLVSHKAPLYGADPLSSKSLAPVVMHAAVNGQETILRELLKAGLKPNLSNGRRDTALTLAAKYNQWGIVILLLDFKADIEARGSDGTALTWAVRCGYAKLTQLLLERGASLDEDSFKDLIVLAVESGHREVIQVLIRAAPVKALQLFVHAAEHGEIPLVACLLESGRGSQGQEWLIWSIQNGYLEAAQLLIKLGVSLPPTYEDKDVLLRFFILVGNPDETKKLLDTEEVDLPLTTPDSLLSPLMCAKLALEEACHTEGSERERANSIENSQKIVALLTPPKAPIIAKPPSPPRRKSVTWELP